METWSCLESQLLVERYCYFDLVNQNQHTNIHIQAEMLGKNRETDKSFSYQIAKHFSPFWTQKPSLQMAQPSEGQEDGAVRCSQIMYWIQLSYIFKLGLFRRVFVWNLYHLLRNSGLINQTKCHSIYYIVMKL